MSTTPSGWYPNPHNAAEELYWDGSRWLGASRVRIVENAGLPAYSATADDATVMRPAGGAWPPPSTYEPGTPVAGGYDPSWDTVPLTVDGHTDPAFVTPGIGASYAAQGYAPFPGTGYAPYPTPGYAQPDGAPFPPPFLTEFPPARTDVLRANGYALASLLLGVGGLILTAVPFLIGLVAGGIPDLLAVVFGVLGIVRSRTVGGAGLVFAMIGTVLGALGLCLMPLGAGWLW